MQDRCHRLSTLYPIQLRRKHSIQKCFITNITAEGAGIFGVSRVEPDDQVALMSPAGNFAATVKWAKDDRCGVLFHQRLGAWLIEQLLRLPTTDLRTGKPVLSFTELR